MSRLLVLLVFAVATASVVLAAPIEVDDSRVGQVGPAKERVRRCAFTDSISSGFQSFTNDAKSACKSIGNGIKSVFSEESVRYVGEEIMTLGRNVKGAITKFVGKMKAKFGNFTNKLKRVFSEDDEKGSTTKGQEPEPREDIQKDAPPSGWVPDGEMT